MPPIPERITARKIFPLNLHIYLRNFSSISPNLTASCLRLYSLHSCSIFLLVIYSSSSRTPPCDSIIPALLTKYGHVSQNVVGNGLSLTENGLHTKT